MAPSAWLAFVGCAFVAETLGTMAGFGAATVLTPIAILFMDAKTAIAVVACFHLFGNASRLVFFGRAVHWDLWRRFGVPGILCSLAGAGVAAWLPSGMLTLLVGLFLLLYAGVSLRAAGPLQLPQTPTTLVSGGLASGFVAGLIGTGGAIRSACLLAFGLPKEVYIGTSAAIALVVDATRIPIYLRQQFLPASMVPVLVSLVAVAFAGAWTGRRIVHRVSPVLFHRIVVVMLALMGIKLFLDGWTATLEGR